MGIVVRQLESPRIDILLIAAVVALLVRDLPGAGFVGAVLLVTTLIGGWREWSADRTSRALAERLELTASETRDGELREALAAQVVPDDIVGLEPGAPALRHVGSSPRRPVDEGAERGGGDVSACSFARVRGVRGARRRLARRTPRASVLLSVALLGAAGTAAAQGVPRLEWDPEWDRVHPASYAVMGAAVAAALVLDHAFEPGVEALVRGPEVFDAPLRARLMSPSEAGREAAAALSDVLLGALLLWPVVDAVAVAGIADRNADVLWQLSSIAAESYAADLLISTIFKQFVARERPHGVRCTLEDRLEDPRRCGPGGRLRSFYSGHSSAAFNAAGVTCVSHLQVPLYGSLAADYAACGVALLSATLVATLRVVADRHYATDVVVGALLGLTTGFLMPYLLYFHQWGATEEAGSAAAGLAWPPAGSTLGFSGAF